MRDLLLPVTAPPPATKAALLHSSASVLTCFLLIAGLSGCDQKKQASSSPPSATNDSLALPLTTGPITPVSYAPPAEALPSAPPVRVVRIADRTQDYAYLDRASATSDAIGEAPPDYGFDYQDVRPWVWHSANNSVTLIEPVEGGYRYYYYQPGANEPYLVRDAQYSYGYSDGQLVTVYDSGGRLLPPADIDQRADYAGRYLARAIALYEASLQSDRHSVNAANWAARRAELDAARSQWEEQQAQQDAWRAYHAEHEAEEQAYWQGERAQRARAAREFDDWIRHGYAGPPPAPAYISSHRDGTSQGGQPATVHGGMDGRTAHPAGQDQQQNAVNQARKQAQADVAHQAQEKAHQSALVQARQQQSHADATHQAQPAPQVKDQQDAIAHARQQQSQEDAAQQTRSQTQQALAKVRQQQVQTDAAKQAQQHAAETATALAQKQKVQADATLAEQQRQSIRAVRAAQQAQAIAAQQAKAQAQQQALAQARVQQAQQNADRQAKASAAAAASAQAKRKAQNDADFTKRQAQAAAAQQARPAAPPATSAPKVATKTDKSETANPDRKNSRPARTIDDHNALDASGRPPPQ